MSALMARLSAHGKSLYTDAAWCLARSHRGNPAASLRVESLYYHSLFPPTQLWSRHPHPQPWRVGSSPATPAEELKGSSASTPAPLSLPHTFSLVPSLPLPSYTYGVSPSSS